MKFRAIIDKNTIIYFTFKDLVDPKPLFSIRELLKPWLLADNDPDLLHPCVDWDGKELYENDIIEYRGSIDNEYGERTVVSNELTNFICCADYTNDNKRRLKYSYLIGNIHLNPELIEREE